MKWSVCNLDEDKGVKMITFIVNPVSGNGQGKIVWKRIEQALNDQSIEYTVHFTAGPRHAMELAREAMEQPGLRAVIAVGGDGTVHEVAQPLVGSGIPLGYIPAGSGNDFGRALGIPTDPIQALERIMAFQTGNMDAAVIDDGWFVSCAGVGFDGAVAKRANESRLKKWFNRLGIGKVVYFLSAVRMLFTYKPTDMTLVIDGKRHEFFRVWMVAVTNIPYYGGGLKICPDALMDDGWLDLCLVQNIGRLRFFLSLPKVLSGSHVNIRGVLMLKAREISIESSTPNHVHTDGEVYRNTPVSIQVREAALRVL